MANRIQAMSLVHQKLYQSGNLSAIKMRDYVHDLTGLLCRGYASEAGLVSFELEIGDTELSVNEAIPLGLILNELVSNSVKHGHRDDLRISICIRVSERAFFSWNTGITEPGCPLISPLKPIPAWVSSPSWPWERIS
jgi:two-component sensor histidine kinase